MSQNNGRQQETFMVKLATFIVDKRNLFFLLAVILLIFSVVARNWVEVESDLTFYLPEDSETKQALNVMEDQFTTYGTAEIMVENITYDAVTLLEDTVTGVKGVQSVTFDDTSDHYNNASALYSVTFDYDENDDRCLEALETVKTALSGYDIYVSTSLATPRRTPSRRRSTSSWCMWRSSSLWC